MAESSARPEDRLISLGDGTFSVPERLLLAHARGEVLFITGAGTSTPARLPDFRKLVLDVYERVEHSMLATLQTIPRILSEDWVLPANNFIDDQNAEIKRFALGDYDVVLGMLERRMEREPGADSNVRAAVVDALSKAGSTPADIHRSLIRLADRGETTTILTTNYDLLLEKAASGSRTKVWSHSLGAIPRPSRRREFGGVLHIHGALPAGRGASSEMVLTDRDFGEYYLRRRVVPDLIYDAARLFHLVLVGYSANDAPMRYLLNAVAADGTRFHDLKERFVFVAEKDPSDPVALSDWKARGMTPIAYSSADRHQALARGLKRWADLSAHNGKTTLIEKEVRRIVRHARNDAPDHDRDLFDHVFRRGNQAERLRIAKIATDACAEPGWLTALIAIAREPSTKRSS